LLLPPIGSGQGFADLSQPIVSENLELKRKWEIGWNNFVEDFNNIPGATNIKIIT
jgi:hypothetical protein